MKSDPYWIDEKNQGWQRIGWVGRPHGLRGGLRFFLDQNAFLFPCLEEGPLYLGSQKVFLAENQKAFWKKDQLFLQGVGSLEEAKLYQSQEVWVQLRTPLRAFEFSWDHLSSLFDASWWCEGKKLPLTFYRFVSYGGARPNLEWKGDFFQVNQIPLHSQYVTWHEEKLSFELSNEFLSLFP